MVLPLPSSGTSLEVIVEHDYAAKESDELSIKKGDVVREVVKRDEGWWEGVLRDRRGLFPANFVRMLDKEAPVTLRNKKDATRIRQCRVVYSYKQEHEDELNLNVGDVVEVIGEEEEGWWKGLLNGRNGVFPSNFVEEIKTKQGEQEIKSPMLPPKPAKILCQANYSYKAQNDDELSLKEGDVITLLNRDGQDPGWWKGELNGHVGVFPDNFVTILDDDKKTMVDVAANSKPQQSAARKSLEDRTSEGEAAKTTPPVPGKKPTVPIKKSPSGSSAQGGLFAGLKKKLVDVVDGASSSKGQPTLIKATEIKEDTKEDIFDQIERTPVLSDVRATRAKAPGRRPPSVVFKETEPGIVNGNAEHNYLDLTEQLKAIAGEGDEVKPRVREWEKNKAPWLEEMKLNQAKRSSTSPGPEQNKLKLTPTNEKTTPTPTIEAEEKSEKTSPPSEMSKSLHSKPKTPEPPVIMRNKPAQPSPRPQSIHALNDKHAAKVNDVVKSPPKTNSFNAHEPITQRQYGELVERIEKLEALLEKQMHVHKVAVDELNSKLEVEMDLRRKLQVEISKLNQGVMQV